MKKSNDNVLKDTLAEITQWENRIVNPNFLQKAGKFFGKPVEWASDLVPNKVMDSISKSIEGLFGLLFFASDYTFSDKSVHAKAAESRSLTSLKKSASSYISENNVLASLQGFGCGLGGIGLVVADIPLLFGIAFRVIQQIGGTFGYDMNSPAEKRFILQIIDLGTSIPTVGKVQTMLGKESLKNYVSKTAFKHMEKVAATRLGQKAIEDFAKETLRAQGRRATQKSVERMVIQISQDVTKNSAKAVAVTAARTAAKDIGQNLTRKKLLQLIPILGGVVGAGFNFWFVRSIAETAYYSYLKRYLHENYEI